MCTSIATTEHHGLQSCQRERSEKGQADGDCSLGWDASPWVSWLRGCSLLTAVGHERHDSFYVPIIPSTSKPSSLPPVCFLDFLIDSIGAINKIYFSFAEISHLSSNMH